jgi:hypothetical protein
MIPAAGEGLFPDCVVVVDSSMQHLLFGANATERASVCVRVLQVPASPQGRHSVA